MRTFMDELRAGWTTLDKVDDYIDRWHDASNPFGPKLHEFLGLTWDEYKRWVETNRLPIPCCDLHNEHCEPPGDLCCHDCTEVNHPQHPAGVACTWK